jgi:hypothetical protein
MISIFVPPRSIPSRMTGGIAGAMDQDLAMAAAP